MSLLVTDAVVLHVFDYLESSRILRLATREAGVQSVLAKGARRSRKRFGSAVDLFAEGVAQLYVKPGRDLHTLSSFEVTRSRAALALDLERFAAASALAELALHFVQPESHPALYERLTAALDAVAVAGPDTAREAALAGAWALVADMGFAPALDQCASCHTAIPAGEPVMFSHPAGGALCPRCARQLPGSRNVPATARDAVRQWLSGERGRTLDEAEGRAHQRLLREFLVEHVGDGRPLRAFEVWEKGRWSAQPVSEPRGSEPRAPEPAP
jgi:DNA repair protein RecO (recombination protein O)